MKVRFELVSPNVRTREHIPIQEDIDTQAQWELDTHTLTQTLFDDPCEEEDDLSDEG